MTTHVTTQQILSKSMFATPGAATVQQTLGPVVLKRKAKAADRAARLAGTLLVIDLIGGDKAPKKAQMACKKSAKLAQDSC